MRELVGRVSALDTEAGAAVRVIAYFDRLVQAHAGLEAIVRGAAMLAGCPACLSDPDRHLRIRVRADGEREDARTAPDPGWPAHHVGSGAAALRLERPGRAGPVDAIVLERAAAAARDVLDRTWGRAPARPGEDPALVELLLDAAAPPQARLIAARRLNLAGDVRVRAVAEEGGRARIERDPVIITDRPGEKRQGVGPAVPVPELPESWRLARVALRLAAEGSAQDPGPRVVFADELGGLMMLAAAARPDGEAVPDVLALERAGVGGALDARHPPRRRLRPEPARGRHGADHPPLHPAGTDGPRRAPAGLGRTHPAGPPAPAARVRTTAAGPPPRTRHARRLAGAPGKPAEWRVRPAIWRSIHRPGRGHHGPSGKSAATSDRKVLR